MISLIGLRLSEALKTASVHGVDVTIEPYEYKNGVDQNDSDIVIREKNISGKVVLTVSKFKTKVK